jgi:hypothetical protein
MGQEQKENETDSANGTYKKINEGGRQWIKKQKKSAKISGIKPMFCLNSLLLAGNSLYMGSGLSCAGGIKNGFV